MEGEGTGRARRRKRARHAVMYAKGKVAAAVWSMRRSQPIGDRVCTLRGKANAPSK